MEELSFNLGLERSIELKLAEERRDHQGRVMSRSEGLTELCSGKNKLGTVVRTKEPDVGVLRGRWDGWENLD